MLNLKVAEKMATMVDNHGPSGQGRYLGDDSYVDSIYSTLKTKKSLEILASRSMYFYMATGRHFQESSLADDRVLEAIASMDPSTRRNLFLFLFSMDSPRVHYHLFKLVQEKMSSVSLFAKKMNYQKSPPYPFPFYDSYLLSLSLISKIYYREFYRDHPRSFSLLTGDVIAIEEALEMSDMDFYDLYVELLPKMEELRQLLGGKLMYYPRKRESKWKLVDQSTFVSEAPYDEGDILNVLRNALTI